MMTVVCHKTARSLSSAPGVPGGFRAAKQHSEDQNEKGSLRPDQAENGAPEENGAPGVGDTPASGPGHPGTRVPAGVPSGTRAKMRR